MKPITTCRQTACRLLAALFFLCLFAPMAAGQDNPATDNRKDHLNDVNEIANTDGGDGTSWDNAIKIASAEELAYFAKQVNSNKSISYGDGNSIDPTGKDQAGGFISYYFALAADIDLSDYDWTPIGNATYPFKGNFDGRGHCVNGLKVMKVETGGVVYAGLFGYAYVGTLRNLGVRLSDAGIQANGGSAYVGGIAGYAHKIFNCYVVGEGTIEASISEEGNIYAGGIVGNLDSDGSLTNCYATVNVKIEPKGTVYVGGIVGYGSSKSTISCTYATGDVETGTGNYKRYAGGICGYLLKNGTLTNSLAVNGRIIGGNSLSNRIVGHNESESTLTGNYASPEIRVNESPVKGGAANDANGNPGVNLDNFGSVFTRGEGWNTGDGTHLPQLKIQKEGTDGKTTYDNWPTGDGYTSQPSLDATRYLIATKFADGNGDKGSPYKIANRAQLAYLAKQVNGGTDNDKKEDYTDKYFILTADIDMSSFFWTPIGKDAKHLFKGNFDGQGHCVKGLKVRQENTKGDNVYAGLFGLASAGTLRNLGVWLAKEGVWAGPSESTEGFYYANAGGIAGQADYIFNCYVTGEGVVEAVGKSKDNGAIASNVSSSSRAGGIVGNLYSSLSNCYATVGVKASGTSDNDVKANSYAGGIAGFGSSDSDYGLSQTYATGVVEAAGDGYNYAGGIYGGHNTGPFSNNLALNPMITGSEGMSGRIFGKTTSFNPPSGNYASPQIKVNGYSVSGGTDSDMNGDPGVDLGNFRFVITWGEGWDISGDGTNLPKLNMKKQDGSYESWPSGQQPSLAAEDYLPAFPKLHIVSPTGGTLTVKDEDGKTVSDDTWIRPGTSLTLTYAENTNYRFSRYLSGNSASNLQTLSGNTIEMPDADLWLSADFNYQDPTPPPPTVYYTVSLPSVEGAVTDPSAGSYEVESWSTFRFYLTLDVDYSESEPVVTTSRGETIMPRTSDGAYLVKYVRTDVEIFIDGIVKNLPPVANEPIRAAASEPEIWSEDACLCIRLPEGMSTSPVRIFTPEGRLLHAFRSTPGLNRRQLPTGIYIVQVGDTVRKVLIK